MSSATKSLKKARELRSLQLYTQQQVPSFSPQCFLLEKAGDIQKAINKEALGTVPVPGAPGEGERLMPVRQLQENITIPQAKSNLSYIQYITDLQKSYYESYFNYSPHDIAQMAHYMSVEEVLTNKKAEIINRTPIMNTNKNLKDYAKADDLLKPTRAKRQGAGIENINIEFVGIDSFTKKQVYMTAKFFFQDIKTMLSSPYANLFTLETSREINNEKAFRSIDFHIGWKSNNPKIKRQISNLNLTVRTHLVKYSFDVRQDGSIVVDGTYRGYYVEGFSGPQANILEIAKTRFLEVKQRQKDIKARSRAIKVRNKKNVDEAQFRKFVLTTIKSAMIEEINGSKEYIRKRKAKLMGELAVAGGSSPQESAAEQQERIKRDVAAYAKLSEENIEYFIKNIKKRARKKIIDVLVATPSLTDGTILTKKDQAAIKNEKGFEGTKRRELIVKRVNKKAGLETIINNIFKGASISTPKDYSEKSKSEDRFFKDLTTTINERIATAEKNNIISQSNIVGSKQAAIEEQTRLASLARLKALQVIAERLTSSSEIFYAKIPRDVVRNFKLGAGSASRANIEAALSKLPHVPNYIKNKLSISVKQFNEESFQVVPFVFFGNLLESILSVPVDYKEEDGKFIPNTSRTVYDLMMEVGSDVKIDLGFLSYNTPFTGTRVNNLQLYYLPISLTELNNFFVRMVISKGKTVYSFSNFINDLLKNFLTGIFSSCSKESNTKGLGAPLVETTIGNKTEDKKNTTQYFIHGGKNTIHDLTKSGVNFQNFGKYHANLEANIPHFFVFGKNTGIEKNIKLIDIADDQLKVAQYYSPRSSLVNDIKGNEQLKRTGFMPTVFQSEVETIGFPLMNLGQLIYIDLKPTITIEDAKARPFDASGYYGIIKVSHSISRDRFSTNITSILQISDMDKDIVRDNIPDLRVPEGDSRGEFLRTGNKAYSSAWESATNDIEEQEQSDTDKSETPVEMTYGSSEDTVGLGIVGVDGLYTPSDALRTAYNEILSVGIQYGFKSSKYEEAKKDANIQMGSDAGRLLERFERNAFAQERVLAFKNGTPSVRSGTFLESIAQVRDFAEISGTDAREKLIALLKDKGFDDSEAAAEKIVDDTPAGGGPKPFNAESFFIIIRQDTQSGNLQIDTIGLRAGN